MTAPHDDGAGVGATIEGDELLAPDGYRLVGGESGYSLWHIVDVASSRPICNMTSNVYGPRRMAQGVARASLAEMCQNCVRKAGHPGWVRDYDPPRLELFEDAAAKDVALAHGLGPIAEKIATLTPDLRRALDLLVFDCQERARAEYYESQRRGIRRDNLSVIGGAS